MQSVEEPSNQGNARIEVEIEVENLDMNYLQEPVVIIGEECGMSWAFFQN
jgi:hypothetical protein